MPNIVTITLRKVCFKSHEVVLVFVCLLQEPISLSECIVTAVIDDGKLKMMYSVLSKAPFSILYDVTVL